MMSGRRVITYTIALLLAAMFVSCSNTKNIPKGDSLFVGVNVNIKDDEGPKKYRRLLKRDLKKAVRPKPNTRTFGMRLKLSLYNLAGDESKGGFFRSALRKIGEPPVLASKVDLDWNNELLGNIMQNRGYFFPNVASHTKGKNKKTKAVFDIHTGPLYKIRNIEFPIDSSIISIDVAAAKDRTLLKPGQPFNLDLIKGERERIDKILTDQGYFYFKPDYIIVHTDSTVGDHQVDMYVRAKHEDIPAQAYYVYHINDVYVYPNYRLNAEHRDTSKANAELHNGFYLIDRRNTFRPIVFDHTMQFQPGELYNRTEQNRALNRLVSLGAFKFVKNRFEAINNPGDPRLDVFYYLTPHPRKYLRFQIGVESQSDSRMGTQSSIGWRHRNAFRGAELFSVTLRGGYEAQAGGNMQRPPAFEGGLETRLFIPRIIVPFKKVVPSSMFTPRTIISAGYDVTLRQDLYLIHSIKTSFGYQWREDLRKQHEFFPININYVKTDTLGIATDQTINFSNIIFNGLIIGPTYEYIYNGQATGIQKHNFYLSGLVDFSNNILGIAQGASPEQPKKIFNTVYAQYMKYRVDGRYYFNYAAHKNNIWANRVILGYGYPYGNSSQLPNIKQFFAGGASSLRGFRSRLVGPGTFNEQFLYGDSQSQRFIETLGDIKLEINTELRANIYQFLNGALFIDAGNVWNQYEDPRFPGGRFSTDFYKELAVDAGFGFRFDFQIFLIRLDLGFPIRKPWLPEGERWVFDEIDFSSKQWRSENLIFNLAIGYPF